MKKETMMEKLNKLLGIDQEVIERHEKQQKILETHRTGKVQGIPESEIQAYREVQGIVYFLQAPRLFKEETCMNPDCGKTYLVSRLHVGCCSYECMGSMVEQNLGIPWSRKDKYEALAEQVYRGNEPLWIREVNLEKLKIALEMVISVISKNEELESSQTDSSPEEPTSSSTTEKQPSPSPVIKRRRMIISS